MAADWFARAPVTVIGAGQDRTRLNGPGPSCVVISALRHFPGPISLRNGGLEKTEHDRWLALGMSHLFHTQLYRTAKHLAVGDARIKYGKLINPHIIFAWVTKRGRERFLVGGNWSMPYLL